MSAVSPEQTPRVAPTFRFQWEEAQNCHVILYPEGMVKLSTSAGEIMKHVTGKQTVEAIVAALSAQFPGADLEADVIKFLEAAHDNGWIRLD